MRKRAAFGHFEQRLTIVDLAIAYPVFDQRLTSV
jgi:hypothetical protein